jgi:hypothetical protein
MKPKLADLTSTEVILVTDSAPGLPEKNHNLGKFWSALDWKMLIYFMAICNIREIIRPFGSFCVHLVHFFRFWYHVPRKI